MKRGEAHGRGQAEKAVGGIRKRGQGREEIREGGRRGRDRRG